MRDSIRYLRIVDWARRRYTTNGRLLTTIFGVPTRFTRIEDLAAVKYMGLAEHYPSQPLCTCPTFTTTSKRMPANV